MIKVKITPVERDHFSSSCTFTGFFFGGVKGVNLYAWHYFHLNLESFPNFYCSTFQRLVSSVNISSLSSLNVIFRYSPKNNIVYHLHPTIFLLTSLALLKMPPSFHLISHKHSDHSWWILLLPLPNLRCHQVPLIPLLLYLL